MAYTSPVGLRAIFTQAQADGAYKPVYYASRALTVALGFKTTSLKMVIYKPGPQNAADSLSHLTVNPPPVAAGDDKHIYFVAKHAVLKAFTSCE